jgi:DNA repair protein RecO (recombination protein O)
MRFLDLLERGVEPGPDPVRDGAGLGFQLKLLALAGYLPHLGSCAGCGSDRPLVGYSAAAGGAVCGLCAAEDGAFRLRPGSLEAVSALVERPLAAGPLPGPAAFDAVRVVESNYEHHGGFRLRTLQA